MFKADKRSGYIALNNEEVPSSSSRLEFEELDNETSRYVHIHIIRNLHRNC